MADTDRPLDTIEAGGRYIQGSHYVNAHGTVLGPVKGEVAAPPDVTDPTVAIIPPAPPEIQTPALAAATGGAAVLAPDQVAAMSVAKLEDYLDGVRDVATLDAIAAAEEHGKNRATAREVLAQRRAQLAPEG